jgi:hypothetical protein
VLYDSIEQPNKPTSQQGSGVSVEFHHLTFNNICHHHFSQFPFFIYFSSQFSIQYPNAITIRVVQVTQTKIRTTNQGD